MMSIFKRGKKKVDPIYFVGKCLLSSEYVSFGPDENYILRKEESLKNLYEKLLSAEDKLEIFLQGRIVYYLEYCKQSNRLSSGVLGPAKDKSGRHYPYMIERQLKNQLLLGYPLFVPSLLNEFYQRALNLPLKAFANIQTFETSVLELSAICNYSSTNDILQNAMDSLSFYNLSSYIEGLKSPKDITALLQVWQFWQEKLSELFFSTEKSYQLIELPNTNNLPDLITFVSYLSSMGLDELAYYRLVWWREHNNSKSWCLITNNDSSSLREDFFFNDFARVSCDKLDHNHQVIGESENPEVNSLYDALHYLSL